MNISEFRLAGALPPLTGAELRGFRSRHNLTQLSLAELIGIKEITIQAWERGRRKISPPVSLLLRVIDRLL